MFELFEVVPLWYAAAVTITSVVAFIFIINYNIESRESDKLSLGTPVVIILGSGLLCFITVPRYLMVSLIKDGQKLGKLPKSRIELEERIWKWFNPTGDKELDASARNQKLAKAISTLTVALWGMVIVVKVALIM